MQKGSIHHWLTGLFLCLFFHAPAQQKLFSTLPSSYTGVDFRNDIPEDQNMYYYLYEYLYNGAGVAIGDINNDGLPDIYFSSTRGSNRLYLNLGNCKFKDISADAGIDGGPGIKTGVNMVDINNDGWLDIFVCRAGPFDPQYRSKVLYINNHNNTFTDRAKEFGLDDRSNSTQSYFFDYDKDGDMDLLLANHPDDFTKVNLVNGTMVNGKLVVIADTIHQYASNRLFENRNGHFFDVTAKAGLLTNCFTLSAGIYDFNDDGLTDIYFANDFTRADYLYINNGNGTFTNKLPGYFNHISFSSMGSDIADINNDGREDLFVLDMAIEDPVRQKQLYTHNLNYDKFQFMVELGMHYQYPFNNLQLHTGKGLYSEIANHAGIAQTDWSWAPLIADFDNDGWKDIYVTNGFKRDITDWDYKEFVLDSIKNIFAKGQTVDLASWFKLIPQVRVKNYLYHNNHSLHFDNDTDAGTDTPPSFSNGAAYADLDNDGDLDIVVNNIDDEAFILRNNTESLTPGHYLDLRFFRSKTDPREVYGTTATLHQPDGSIQYQRYDPQRSYLSSMDHKLHFGTGTFSMIPKLEVRFPSGKTITLKDVNPGQTISLYESDAMDMPPPQDPRPLFTETAAKQKIAFTHKEDDYIDFKREPLIPYKCSRKGPFYSKADVNGDQRPDLFIGGATGSEGKLFLQNADGSYTEKKQAAFGADKLFEDNGVLLFDADGDGDNDLYVVSGGAAFDAGSPRYQDRLYLNDGKGNFTRSLKALPKEGYNGSCVIALDFDGDGDQDLFIGGGVTPGQFPKHDPNMLLQNNKGVFTDVTAQFAPDLAHTGIVNAAAWADPDGSGSKTLLIAGEWMPLMFLQWKDGKFQERSFALQTRNSNGQMTGSTTDQLKGWWNCIRLADIDQDGDMDILLGNRGTNSKITASYDQPCTVYAKDFDNNGSYDAVLGYYIWGKCYPMYHRDQLIDQMPFLRKKFYRYHLYAGVTMDELFTPEQQKGMERFSANCFESGILINEGNTKFRFEPLPEMAQLSDICDILVRDLDGDGIADLLLAGNNNDADVSTGNYDAMATLLLKGSGDGHFRAVEADRSGLRTKGEVRKIVPLEDEKTLLLLKNNAAPVILTRQ